MFSIFFRIFGRLIIFFLEGFRREISFCSIVFDILYFISFLINLMVKIYNICIIFYFIIKILFFIYMYM